MKRIISLLLAACLSVSMLAVGVSATAAVDEGTVEQTVKALGIMAGDSSGNMNLSSAVTRAEFATMLVAASTYKDSVGNDTSYSLFPDVTSSHWAVEYVKLAVDNGWFTGYSDGTFGPSKNITLEAACTTVLNILGYTSSTLKGSFPSAQLSKASALGLRDNISKTKGQALTRKDCMYLFYNMLSAKTINNSVYATTLGYSVNSAGKVNYASLVSANMVGPVVAASSAPALSFTPTTVYRNGIVSSLSAITQYDVYYYHTGLKTVWAYSDRVAGTLTARSSDSAPTTATVGGNSYTLGTSTATYKLSAMGGASLGDTVTLLLGMDGSVADVLTGTASNSTYYGVVISYSHETSTVSGATSVRTLVKVACTDGQTHTFTINSSATFSTGRIVVATIANGTTTVKGLTDKTISGRVNTAGTKLGDLTFADNVQILDSNEKGGYAVTYVSRLKGVTLSASDVRYYALDASGNISYLILDDVTGDIWTYCVFTSVNESSSSGPVSYQYMKNGTSSSMSSEVASGIKTGAGAILYAETSVANIKNLTGISLAALSSLTATATSGGTFDVDDDVQVYIGSNGSYYATTISAISDTSTYRLTGYYDDFGCTAGKQIRVIVATAN